MYEIGTLQIKMAADLASLKRDMDDAKRTVGSAMQEIERYTTLAKQALVAFAGVATINAFAGMIKGAIDSSGKMHDLSIQTGASVAALGQFRGIGSYTETSLDSITGAMGKLSKAMSSSDEDSRGAAAALKIMGVDFKSFAAMSPDQQMLTVANSMAQYADGANKSAIAQALFGREGAKMLPFLADLAEQSDQVATKLSDQEIALRATQAAMADAYGDNLTRIRKESEGWKKDLANGLLPALWETSEAFLRVATGAGGLKEAISTMAKDGTFAEWVRTAVTGITYLADEVQAMWRMLQIAGLEIGAFFARLGNSLGGVGTAVVQMISGQWGAAVDTIKSMRATNDQIRSDVDADVAHLASQALVGQKFRAQMAQIKGTAPTTQPDRPQAPALAQQAADDNARQLAEYDKLVASIHEKVAAQQAEVDQGAKLTEEQKVALDIMVKIRDGQIKLTDGQKSTVASLLDTLVATGQLNDARKLDIEASRHATAERWKAIEAAQKEADSIQQQVDRQRTANAEIGLTADAVASLEAARLREQATALDRLAVMSQEEGANSALSVIYADQADRLRELAGLKQDAAAIKAAQDEAREWQRTADTIYSSLSSAFERGINAAMKGFKGLRDYIISTLKDQAIKAAGESMASAIMGGYSGSGGASTTALALAYAANNGAGGNSGGSGGSGGSTGAGMVSMTGGGGSGAVAQAAQWAQLAKAYGGSSGMTADFVAGYQGSSANLGAGMAGPVTDGAGGATGAGASSAGWGSVALWVAAAIMGTIKANRDYSEGFNSYGTNNLSSQYGGGGLGNYELQQQGVLKGLGMGDRWASLLSGTTAMAKIFGRAAPQITDAGLQGTLGGQQGSQLEMYANVWEKGGLLKRSKDYQVQTGLDSGTQAGFGAAVHGIQDQVRGYLDALGMVSDGIDSFTQAIHVSMTGLDAAGQKAAIEKELAGFGEALSDAVAPAVAALRRDGETTGTALQRLVGNLAAVNAQLDLLGHSALSASLDSARAAQDMVDAFGGLDKLGAATSKYFDTYYTDAERAAKQTGLLRKQFDALGVTMPATRAAFRQLVDAQDLTTDAGRSTYASLLQLSDAFAQLSQATQAAGQTVSDEIKRLRGTTGGANAATKAQLQAQFVTTTAQARAGDAAALAALPDISKALDDVALATAGSTAELASVRAWLSGSLADTLKSLGIDVPKFSTGGMHTGGLRLVGEQGPELEATGPARIWSARQTAAMLGAASPAGADRAALAALPDISRALEDLAAATKSSAAGLAGIGAMLGGTGAGAGIGGPAPAAGVVVPSFAAGGLHAGGLRLVGEQGPELEATGPARIWSATQTAQIIAGSGATGAVGSGNAADEVRAMRAELAGMRAEHRAASEALVSHASKTARILTRITQNGDAMTTTPLA